METPGGSSPSLAQPQHSSWMAGQRLAGRHRTLPQPAAPWTACGRSTESSSKAQAGSWNGRTFLPSSRAAPLGIVHSYKLPNGVQDFQQVSSG